MCVEIPREFSTLPVGMQEHTVICRTATSIGPPNDMMVVPSRQAGDFLVAGPIPTIVLPGAK
jgi:hypothetical protein